MKNYCLKLALLLTTISLSTTAYGQDFNRISFEATIQKGIAKAYAASVKIWGIDTLTKRQNSAQFTGVVIDADGYILTAAHAIQPSKRYKVIFPDGKEYTAEGLGGISYEPKTGRPDVAMIKIIEKGTWPIAEMGWSNSLKVNEACISIAYPTTLSQVLPTIRVGRITNPLGQWGFVHSTCKMEPGDSGGPLFDYMGRVIGIHSRIDVAEDVNYEVPVDLYRKYFTALKVATDYPALPEKEDEVGIDPKANSIQAYSALLAIKDQFLDFEIGLKENSLMIKSTLKGNSSRAIGTLFYFDMPKKGSLAKGKSFIVSKSSLVGDSIMVYLGDRKLEAIVISRNRDHDLVLLQLKTDVKSGIKLSAIKDGASTKIEDIGKFLISILPDRTNEISVLSSGIFNQPKKFSSGFFGASANFISEQIILTRIAPGSPAEKAGLQLKDQITGVNNITIKLPPDYGGELMKYEPGETITIQGVRNGTPYSLPVFLTNMPQTSNHPSNFFAGGKSARLDGFTGVFAHDAIIKPEECGGPIFDKEGKFYGINIARFSRTACLAFTSAQVYDFISNAASL